MKTERRTEPKGASFGDWMAYLKATATASFRSLRVREYRIYWVTQLVSLAGTWMQTVAQSWLVLELSGSAVALGTVVSAQFLPILVFSLFAGVIVDRFPRRKVLLVTQTLSALQALSLAGLVFSGAAQLWHVYLLAAILGCINAVDTPARQSFVGDLVDPEDLQNAVALNSTLFNAARLIGPAVGGLAILYLGVGGCFLLNALSFLPLVIALALAVRPRRGRATMMAGSVLRGVWEGISFAFHHSSISVAVIMLAFIGTFGYNFTVLLALLARYAFNVGAEGLGALTASMGFGALTGALLMAGRRQPSRRLLFLGALSFSSMEVVLALVAKGTPFGVGVVVVALMGLAGIVYTTTTNAMMQISAPLHLRGRILSLYVLLFAGSTPVGSAFTGLMVDLVGLQPTIALEAGLCFLGVALAALYSRARWGGARPEPAL